MIKYFYFTLLILIILPYYCLSQATVLIQGVVTEKENSNPVKCKVEFIPTNGNNIPANTNPTDGSYTAVLKSGETYNVEIDNAVITSNNNMFSLPKSNEYNEVKINFTISKLKEGKEVFSFNFFPANKSTLNKNLERSFGDIKEFTEQFKKVRLKVLVSCEDSKFKSTTKKVLDESTAKSKKKKYNKITISADESARKLGADRIETIKTQLLSLGIPAFVFQYEYVPKFENVPNTATTQSVDDNKSKKKSKDSAKKTKEVKPNFKIIVDSIMKFD